MGKDEAFKVIQKVEIEVQTNDKILEEEKSQEKTYFKSKEVQTEQIALEKNYATPIDCSKKKNSKSSDEKEAKSNMKESVQDFPCQMNRGRQVAKPLRFTSEQNLELKKFTSKV